MENKRKVYKMELSSEEDGVFAISLVESPAIEQDFIYLSKQELVNLSTIDAEKRILMGPVLIPNLEIQRLSQTGEEYSIVFPEDVVEKSAQLFLQRQKNNNTTLEHDLELQELSVVESWIIADSNIDKSAVYGMKYPKGTWMVTMKVNNEEVWNDYVKTRKVRGFSLEGLYQHRLVNQSKVDPDKEKIEAIKKILDVYTK